MSETQKNSKINPKFQQNDTNMLNLTPKMKILRFFPKIS